MGLIASVLLGALAMLGAVCVKVFADEFKAWAPTIVAKIVGAAVRTLPPELRERFSEEWLSHIDQIPGDLGKFAGACGFVIAAFDMANGPFGLRKRVLDIAFAGISLVALAPLLATVALAVRLDSAGPILARHTRVGRRGKPFEFLKFRTTSVDSARQRVTSIGRLLRRVSFDVLPQLLNVLSGDMSMVGPRPLSVEDNLGEQAKLSCKPGLTGLWAFGPKDLASYVGDWSLKLDAKILLATVYAAVVNGEFLIDDFEACWKKGLLITIMFSLLMIIMLIGIVALIEPR
jgi:lipopolysaccharide/colanic/teichoic acid biosynthesis glycosyltransferase